MADVQTLPSQPRENNIIQASRNKYARAWISSMFNSLQCKDIASVVVTFCYCVQCLSWIIISNIVQSSTIIWLFLRTTNSTCLCRFLINCNPPLIVCFGTQKISMVLPSDKCSCSTHRLVIQAQMACIKCLFYNIRHILESCTCDEH